MREKISHRALRHFTVVLVNFFSIPELNVVGIMRKISVSFDVAAKASCERVVKRYDQECTLSGRHFSFSLKFPYCLWNLDRPKGRSLYLGNGETPGRRHCSAFRPFRFTDRIDSIGLSLNKLITHNLLRSNRLY